MCSKNLPSANTVIITTHVTGSCLGSDAPLIFRLPKVELIWKLVLNQEFTGFPARISKCSSLMVVAIKMLLDNAYGLLNLHEFKHNHFNSIFQAESEFKNLNSGGKSNPVNSCFSASSQISSPSRNVHCIAIN